MVDQARRTAGHGAAAGAEAVQIAHHVAGDETAALLGTVHEVVAADGEQAR
jgi:hypothetical protein